MMHPGLAALNGQWNKVEYVAVFWARFAAIPDSEQAHHCWQAGWEDADTELLESSRHSRFVSESREDDYSNTWGLLFDAGGDARGNGIPFDESRTAPWKEGWIDANINFGVHGIVSL